MGHLEIITELLLVALKMWDRHDKDMYYKELREIRRKRYAEEAKSVRNRDQAMLDHYDHELLILSKRFISATSDRGQNTPSK